MRELEKKLDYTFHDAALLEEALNHSSYANEHRAAHLRSNERLEFLGDSVLGFVTAEFLFTRHPDAPEGDLTRIRAALVCEQSLYEVAQRLGLGQYLKLGRGEEAGGGRERTSILADAVEAVFAAVYLDGGIGAASALIHRVLLDAQRESVVEERRRDYKTALQELVQRQADQVLSYRMVPFRSWCSVRRIRCSPTGWWMSRARITPRPSRRRCCSTARPWGPETATAKRRPSRPPPRPLWRLWARSEPASKRRGTLRPPPWHVRD